MIVHHAYGLPLYFHYSTKPSLPLDFHNIQQEITNDSIRSISYHQTKLQPNSNSAEPAIRLSSLFLTASNSSPSCPPPHLFPSLTRMHLFSPLLTHYNESGFCVDFVYGTGPVVDLHFADVHMSMFMLLLLLLLLLLRKLKFQ